MLPFLSMSSLRKKLDLIKMLRNMSTWSNVLHYHVRCMMDYFKHQLHFLNFISSYVERLETFWWVKFPSYLSFVKNVEQKCFWNKNMIVTLMTKTATKNKQRNIIQQALPCYYMKALAKRILTPHHMLH